MQEFEKQTIHLKNGEEVIIRLATIPDAEKLLNTLKMYIPQSEYIPKFGHEIMLTVEQEAAWIDSFLTSSNSLLLIAEHEGEIIGNIDLTGSRREAMEHTAVVGMGMTQEWKSQGLGTALLQAAIDWARQNPILELLWLEVYTENAPGIGLYNKLGFSEHGIIRGFFKHGDTYFDKLTMTLRVK